MARSDPQPGQSMPNKALVGHSGDGPPGVVGSANQIPTHPRVTPPTTTAGPATRWWVTLPREPRTRSAKPADRVSGGSI